MRILVTRPPAAAARTAQRLRERGHDILIAPLLDIVPSHEPMPAGAWDALVLTSENALVALPDPPACVPVLAVGDRTAAAAEQAGFTDVRSAEGDRHALALLAQEGLPPGSRLLIVAGRDRKDDLAPRLREAGHEVTLWTAYAAEAAETLPADARSALADGDLDAALHYSRRSAAICLALARRAGLEAPFLRLFHVCLSEDVAAPLREAGAAGIITARRPDETALIEAIPSVPPA